MPAGMEQVLNKPLSGGDIRKCILADIAEALEKDCFLSDTMAFPAFRYKCDIAIVLRNAVHPEVNKPVTGGTGDMAAGDPTVTAESTVVHSELPEMPPNEARVQAGLGVPVLTRDEKGREVEREVKYAKGTKGHGNSGGNKQRQPESE